MCLKFLHFSYTLPTDKITWHKFRSFSLNIVKRGKGSEKQIVRITVFPIIFATDCLKNLQSFKCDFLPVLILNQIEGMYLPITSLLFKS